jgi:hypothetical protein
MLRMRDFQMYELSVIEIVAGYLDGSHDIGSLVSSEQIHR